MQTRKTHWCSVGGHLMTRLASRRIPPQPHGKVYYSWAVPMVQASWRQRAKWFFQDWIGRLQDAWAILRGRDPWE